MGNKSTIVENYLINLIETSDSSITQKLPSENTLCRILGVSRQVCRPVLSKLQERGLIFKRQGSGSFISSDAKKILHSKKVKKRVLSIILPEFKTTFMHSLLSNIEACAEQDYSVIIYNSENNPKKEVACIKRAIEFGTTGLIIYPANNTSLRETIFIIENNKT